MDFVCPHCGTAQTGTSASMDRRKIGLKVGDFAEADGAIQPLATKAVVMQVYAWRCANERCRGVVISASASAGIFSGGEYHSRGEPFTRQMPYPGRSGLPFDDSVPKAMLQDYNEAWSIVDLSPKSSATLARRCLQAMIRDFCNIRERTLFKEIEILEQRLADDDLPKGVDIETVAAMKALKDVGNIGAHMTEVDGVIVDVAAEEAESLLHLIEMLFRDWYVARNKRRVHLAEIQAMAEGKKSG